MQAFQNLTKSKITTYIPYLEKERYTRGETVYKEGDPALCIYIVKAGEFELERKIGHFDTKMRKGYERPREYYDREEIVPNQ